MKQISIKDLSLKEKIAQLFIIGFQGNNCDPYSDIYNLIKNFKPGGVILFDKDMVFDRPVKNIESPDQLSRLTEQLQSISKTPLLIGVDQEGGVVNRLKPEYGFPETTSHKELGKMDNLIATEKEGALISSTLAKNGINLNFAPCVDLDLNSESSIISQKGRCFSPSSLKVKKHAQAYIQGHEANTIITTLKHFPGHGSAAGDTHEGFVDVTDTWTENELEPYRNLIESHVSSFVMISHIFNKDLDSDYPATLSFKIITDLLRKGLGYNGVVVSDDMQMKAISDHFSLEESLRLGLEAGLDIFCFGNNLLEEPFDLNHGIDCITDLITKEIITEQRINESVSRILEVKNSYLIN